jgi:hypothetical protein
MVTKVRAERAEMREKYDNRCVCCGDGPLVRRALHVVTLKTGERVPSCTECLPVIAAPNPGKALRHEFRKAVYRYLQIANFALRTGAVDDTQMHLAPPGLLWDNRMTNDEREDALRLPKFRPVRNGLAPCAS